jgi:hypothetical protein
MKGLGVRGLAVLAAAVVLACGPATAAPPRKAPPPADPPMQVQVVRSAHPGCEPQCPQWIAAQGRIVTGTAAQFRKVLAQLGERKLPVLVDSGGGAVDDALAIGRLIRAKGLQVAVTRTTLVPCAPQDAACRKAKAGRELRGLAQAHPSKCASSCAFILAGGAQRLVGPGTGVGVHQISMTLRRYLVLTRRSFGGPVETRRTLVSERTVSGKHAQTQATYARIRQFLAEMGIGEEVMALIMSTPHTDIRWLAPNELQATRLATDFINGEELVTGVPASTLEAPPPPTTVPGLSDLMGYNGICQKAGMCEIGAAATNPRFDLPGYVPNKAPHVAAPSPEGAKAEQGEGTAQ